MTCMDRVEWEETYYDTLIIDFCKKHNIKVTTMDYDDFVSGLSSENYKFWEDFLEVEYMDYAASYYDFMREAQDKRDYGWP